MKSKILTICLLFLLCFAQTLGSSRLPETMQANLEAFKNAQKLDAIISGDLNNYEAVQIANKTDFYTDSEIQDYEVREMSYLDLYYIDMDLVNRKLKLSGNSVAEELDETINILANEHGLDPNLVKAVIRVESFYRPTAESYKGACGLMQLMPRTATDMGVSDIFNPIDNIIGGIKYLKKLQQRYKSNVSLMLAAYNAGPGNVRKYRGIPPYPETVDYVKKVIEFKKIYEEV